MAPVLWFFLETLALLALLGLNLAWKHQSLLPQHSYVLGAFETLVMHGLAAWVVNRSALSVLRRKNESIPWGPILLSYALATGVDVDHFVAARSFDWFTVANTDKAIGHSILVALVVGGLVRFRTRQGLYGWIASAALLSHVFIDITHAPPPPYLWPFPSPLLPYWVGLCLLIGLLATGHIVVRLSPVPNPPDPSLQ